MHILVAEPEIEDPKFDLLKNIVRLDFKQRYGLSLEDAEGSMIAVDLNATSSDTVDALWWIKARQGQSIKVRYFSFSTIDLFFFL